MTVHSSRIGFLGLAHCNNDKAFLGVSQMDEKMELVFAAFQKRRTAEEFSRDDRCGPKKSHIRMSSA